MQTLLREGKAVLYSFLAQVTHLLTHPNPETKCLFPVYLKIPIYEVL
ncbi:hypothetical protein SAMN04488491_2247 [Psychrobacter sp. LV10R520-6]|nr:hypothetical protein SAMN04488491_2247 [Psychrobacter sp. LV10R520-6]